MQMIHGDSSSSNPGALLAPGFRFHPTDEELVRYYLKRKITGRPLRFDAIADVDVYRSEPWDLPAMSRLRSRDMEWYFFCTLDRKYSGSSRTNRATNEGYWKTTGKDRAVLHRSAVVGMKKTLVFHVGRAPKGQRTNWVMHEYRLLDENAEASASASCPSVQDAFVVCRIFQKSGTGPQNGAQYGAPFIEEEWEEEDEQLYTEPPKEEEHFSPNEHVRLDDFEQKQDEVNEHEIPILLTRDANGQDDGIKSEDPANLFDEMFDVVRYVNAPELQDDPTMVYNLEENTGLYERTQSPDQNDGYLELKDIFGNDQNLVNGMNETPTSQGVDDTAFFDNLDVIADTQELGQMCLPVEGTTDGSPNLVAGDYNSAQLSEDNMMFYDAPGQELLYTDDIFTDANQLQFSPAALELDDLMTYFDATDNNLQYIQDYSGSVEFGSSKVAQSNTAPEVEYKNTAFKATPEILGANKEGASSSTRSVVADKKFENINENILAASDVQRNGSWNKSLRKHVVNMLGSINAPPAMAEDLGKQRAIQLMSTTHSSSSIHVSAGMIRVHGALMGSAEQWTLQKTGDVGFFLSYGIACNNVVCKSACFESITKMQGGAMSMMLRGGFYLFGISMLILAISFKVGMCIYGK
ncbi:Uncharacterized protein M6B38_112195 [Iris pallida]|uniref:NAC domain-containing protein n=1 Tax=Iris pallida TaxID=29817 RepID=A0AAX6DMJ4_IRIPA|nr:Uncharacterized protein M6B38_112195 [Iris pallida]